MGEENLTNRHDRAIDLLERFQTERGVDEAFRRMMRFMISYLSLMKDSLPKVATKGLAVAERYHGGAGSKEEIELARDDCWNFLKCSGSEYDFDTRESRAIRAVLSTLETDPAKHDLGEAMEWFLTFSDGVEDHSSKIRSLIKEHFA